MPHSDHLLGSRPAAFCLILAPLFEIVEAVLSPLRDGSTAADIAAIQAHQGRFTVSVLVGLAATWLYVPAFLGAGRLAAPRNPRLAATATSLLVAAMLGFAGIRMGQALELAAVHRHMPPATLGDLLDAVPGTAPGAAIMAVFLVGSTLGLWLLAAALWRADAVPRPFVAALAAFPVIDLALHGHLATIAAHLVMAAGLGAVGLRLLSRSPGAVTGLAGPPEDCTSAA
ncbi:hypothetical protein ABZT08_13920 [Streptomyces sp. NPDC005526]|uniref:hypothetical protein n=1 Tax=Streptomyces sp. NPDC005526 TaxID=3156885 RepID=UPI0033A4AF7E